jgi:mono/diheme cytochrome c family protein
MEEPMQRTFFIALVLAVVATATNAAPAAGDPARGKYLVSFAGCVDCHTPGYFLGKPDMKRFLGGSDVGFPMPGLGIFYGPNLTPDKKTGLGNWSKDDIVKAIRTGERPDGRMLAPIMPVSGFSHLTDDDVYAIAAYLKTLPPVSHKAPGPFGPDEKPTSFVMPVIPADVYMKLPKPPPPKPK